MHAHMTDTWRSCTDVHMTHTVAQRRTSPQSQLGICPDTQASVLVRETRQWDNQCGQHMQPAASPDTLNPK